MTQRQHFLRLQIAVTDRTLASCCKKLELPKLVCTATAEMELGVTSAWLAKQRDVNGGPLQAMQAFSAEKGHWIQAKGLIVIAYQMGMGHEPDDYQVEHELAPAIERSRTDRQCLPLAWNLEAIRGHLLAESFAKEQQRR